MSYPRLRKVRIALAQVVTVAKSGAGVQTQAFLTQSYPESMFSNFNEQANHPGGC